MKRLLRVVGIAFAGLVVLAVAAYAVVYVVSERVLQHAYAVPAVTLAIPTDAESIQEGRRLATVRGCVNGCHGKDGGGAVMFDQPLIAHLVAPNLTTLSRRYSDAQIAAIIRHGLRPNGRSVVVMPAEAYGVMNDADLGRTIAFLKTLPAADGPETGSVLGPLGRRGIVLGKYTTSAQTIADTVPPPEAADAEAATGRYLARSICAACHGTNLRGDSNPDFTSPALRIVLAYSPEAFAALMRSGTGLGGRQLKTMGVWAKQHLSQLNDAEIAALYRYLHGPEAGAGG